MAAPAAKQPVPSPIAAGRTGAISGSSCAVGGTRSGQQAAKSAAAGPAGGTSPAVGQSRTPLAQLPAVPVAGTAVGSAAAVQCESGGQVSGVDTGRAMTAISGAGECIMLFWQLQVTQCSVFLLMQCFLCKHTSDHHHVLNSTEFGS